MANEFPASAYPTSRAWQAMTGYASKLKNAVQILRDASAAGDTLRPSYNQLQRELTVAIDEWSTAVVVPGLQAYARDQLDDQLFDLTLSHTQMSAAAVTLRQWIFDNIPHHNPTGAPLLYSDDLTGNLTALTFTTAQTSVFRTECDAFLATIV